MDTQDRKGTRKFTKDIDVINAAGTQAEKPTLKTGDV